MTRSVLILFAMLCSINLFAQINGEYKFEKKNQVTLINFFEGSKFVIKIKSDCGTSVDTGYYVNEKRKIAFHFNGELEKPEPSYCSFSKKENNSDSIDISVKTFTKKKNKILDYCDVFLTIKKDKLLVGAYTDSLGTTKLMLPKSLEKITLHIQCAGYEKYTCNFIADSSYNFNIGLSKRKIQRKPHTKHDIILGKLNYLKTKIILQRQIKLDDSGKIINRRNLKVHLRKC